MPHIINHEVHDDFLFHIKGNFGKWCGLYIKYQSFKMSTCMVHTLTVVITCAKYGKSPSRTVRAVDLTRQDANIFHQFLLLNDLWRYRSMSLKIQAKIKGRWAQHILSCYWSFLCKMAVLYFLHSTSVLSFHIDVVWRLFIWKESIQKCRRYRADTKAHRLTSLHPPIRPYTPRDGQTDRQTNIRTSWFR